MVGHPKSLHDLHKIDAGVKVTCRLCKRERLLNRDRLIAELVRRGHSTSWEMLPARLRCACGSKSVEIVAMPFTDGDEDGETLFEALVRAYEQISSIRHPVGSAEWCKAMSDSSGELHRAKVAMRAWIVARAKG